jgi:hypothetical protein
MLFSSRGLRSMQLHISRNMYGIIVLYASHGAHDHDVHKPGGAGLLRKYSAVAKGETSHSNGWSDASWAFGGGLNNHSRGARRRMEELKVAKIQLDVGATQLVERLNYER